MTQHRPFFPSIHFWRVVFIFALLACRPAYAADLELRPFDVKSLAAIKEAHAGRAFVLAFWSIHCAPCQEEMIRLKAIRSKYPNFPLILVATDPPEAKTEVLRFLQREAPPAVDVWAFADAFEERVRFSVDRSWHGELPRTYFFDSQHRVVAHSGAPDPAWLGAWLGKNAAPKKS